MAGSAPNRITAIAFIVACMMTFGLPASATVYDLNASFSTVNSAGNPFVVEQGSTPLSFVVDWLPITGAPEYNPPSGHIAQPAFAAGVSGGNAEITPAWFQAAVTPFTNGFLWNYGDIIVQTTVGAVKGPTSVLWTSPSAGTGTVSGILWDARNSLQVAQQWELLVNNVSVDSGSVPETGAVTESDPTTFDVTGLDFAAGDTVQLSIFNANSSGDLVGTDLTITENNASVPEPSALMILFLPIAGLLMAR